MKSPEQDLRALGWAWVLGMFSHAIADQWFHPWVFFFSGDYYHPEPLARAEARRKHRLLEVYLDDWICTTRGGGSEEISAPMLMCSLRGAPLSFLCDRLGEVLTERTFSPEGSPDNTSEHWYGALWEAAVLQWGFRNRGVGALLHLLANCKPQRWAEFEALLSFRRSGLGGKLAGRYHYRNPVTGEPCDHTLDDLFNGAVADCARLFTAIDSQLDDSQLDTMVVPVVLRTLRGVSLNYGVWGADPGAATNFAEQGLLLPGLGTS
ncbi:MAG: hypothetical protein EBZ48_16940 [Proteobacteria bacterium]|nr:hypothetical protein [Pseudomonadota bacterium]